MDPLAILLTATTALPVFDMWAPLFSGRCSTRSRSPLLALAAALLWRRAAAKT
jgi:hypothetical protein